MLEKNVWSVYVCGEIASHGQLKPPHVSGFFMTIHKINQYDEIGKTWKQLNIDWFRIDIAIHPNTYIAKHKIGFLFIFVILGYGIRFEL